MSGLPEGAYERLVTEAVEAELAGLNPDSVQRERIDGGDAADRFARHLAATVERILSDVPSDERVTVGLNVVNSLLNQLAAEFDEETAEAVRDDELLVAGEVLRAIRGRRPDGKFAEIELPEIPLLDTTLLTNAPGEPTLWAQLRSEIASSDRIDLLMAFVRRSGLRPLLESLRQHCASGKQLRVLTTTFTGSTEQSALDQLVDLGAEIKVSYDTTASRLHAKAWLFQRDTGLSTAYVGSSNMTHSAQAPGLEWNVRLSKARNEPVFTQFDAVFASYWLGGDFVEYDAETFRLATQHQREESTFVLSPLEVRLYPFQERLLELLRVSRERGYHRNLLAAATGTGKTVMAAADYARLRSTLPRTRLLFVAHRSEILEQSRNTFRQVLRDPNFGEQWFAGMRPSDNGFDHVFASIQTLSANDLNAIDPTHFDVVIVDEFHHAAAASYDRVLNRLAPIELLGLTATPERADGAPILPWFDGRIAAELRIWDAIDQQHLAPFVYFGLSDGSDLRDVPWRRGRGYDIDALSNVYTSDQAWARLVINRVADHTDLSTMRGFGFCVSVAHADFMAAQFSAAGVPAIAVSAQTSPDDRRSALTRLRGGEIKVVFAVDLFNEGVDVPDVDTVLMLRPTESPVVFLQQLGRGLRKTQNKPYCTVLDFIGQHRREFRFDRRFRALLGGTRKSLETAVKSDFPYLPAGCSMHLDRVASEVVLRSIRDAIPSTWAAIVSELASLGRDQPDLKLASFLDDSGLDLDDVYTGRTSNNGWSDLRQAAGLPVLARGPYENELRHAVGRLTHVDDELRLTAYQQFLSEVRTPQLDTFNESSRRLFHMLASSMCGGVVSKSASPQQGVDLLWQHPQVIAELRELFAILSQRVDHLHAPLGGYPEVPLQIHARYTRVEILAALAEYATTKIPAWQSGVRQATSIDAELFAFTFDKSTGNFSPTTRYRDYAISPTLIHWESQSITRADSPTGLRYRHHESDGRSILLFARHHSNDRSYWFLGPATYVSHVGERPMAITWRLHHALPSDLYQSFAAAVG